MSNKYKNKFNFKASNSSAKKTNKSNQQVKIESLLNEPRKKHDKRSKLLYDEFHDLDYQRMLKIDELKESLIKECKRFKFKDWIRCVSYKYSNHPLSSAGSIKSIGGRFNIGEDVNEIHFTAFNALYIAEDADTALLEKFGAQNDEELSNNIFLCLAKKESFTIATASGELNNVLDLDKNSSLKTFVNEISTIKYSAEIQERRKAEGMSSVDTLNSKKALLESLYSPDWRFTPQIHDLPANCQVFGQIAYYAGVEAILYKSTKDNKKCLAIFPKNLADKSSIDLTGALPDSLEISTLNKNTFEKCL